MRPVGSRLRQSAVDDSSAARLFGGAAALLAVFGAAAVFTSAVGFRGPRPPLILLLTVPTVLIACRLTGRLAARWGQPAVVGEIVTGIALGPSVLGQVWPAGQAELFAPSVVPCLNLIAQLGLALFMFQVGRELNPGQIRNRWRATLWLSQSALVVPLCAGVALAPSVRNLMAGSAGGHDAFVLLFGVGMSVTAFPVLARILQARGLERTPLADLVLAGAAIGDLVGWFLLALLETILGASGQGTWSEVAGRTGRTAALLAGVTAVLVLALRPALSRLARSRAMTADRFTPILLTGIFISAAATAAIGLHPIFGAFLFGVVAPRDQVNAIRAANRLKPAGSVTLPVFFVIAGLQTRVALIGVSVATWGWLAVIIGVAVLSKSGAAGVSTHAAGFGTQDSARAGILMNCRGVTELVVLSIGLRLHVLNTVGFTMLVLMTLVTTLGTSPMLGLVERLGRRSPARDATRHSSGHPESTADPT